jgi:predicted metal-dependent hydrolase
VSEELRLPFPSSVPLADARQPPVDSEPPPADVAGSFAPDTAPLRVEVTRSAKRRRTVGARLVGDVLRIAIPSWMSRADEQHWTAEMTRRFERMRSTERIDLTARAASLARRYRLAVPADIRWSDDMSTRWGSCTPDDGTIRISTRVAAFPDWVVDYVLVHELAHLSVPGHGEAFWQLVHRYAKAERAIGYLIARSDDAE